MAKRHQPGEGHGQCVLVQQAMELWASGSVATHLVCKMKSYKALLERCIP